MSNTPTLYDDETGEERELPYRWTICGTCRGEGKSCAYLGAFTAEDMREDPDFAEDYRSGFYDRACDECGGTGKVKVVDEERTPKGDLEAYRQHQQDMAELRQIERQEYLFCGGWREEGGR